MKITLAKIKEHHPCHDGWEQILAAQGPDLDREWPLVEAFDSNGFNDVLWALCCLPEHNDLWRKYAVWCVKQVEHLLKDQRSKNALEVAWAHSGGMATDAELVAASDAASDAARAAITAQAARYAAWAAAAAASDAASDAAWAAASDAARAARAARYAAGASARAAAEAVARAVQKDKMIQILTAGEWVEDEK